MDISALMDQISEIINAFWPTVSVIGGLLLGIGLWGAVWMQIFHAVKFKDSPYIEDDADGEEALDDPDTGLRLDLTGVLEDEVIEQVPAWETFCHYCGTGFAGEEKQCKHCGGKRQQLT